MPRYRIHSILRNVPEEMKLVRKNRRKWESSRGSKMKGFKMGIGSGYSYLLAVNDAPTQLRPYVEKLKSGFNIEANATYFFGRFFGLGVSYSLYHAENRLDNVYVFNGISGNIGRGELSDNVNIHFIGLHPTARVPIAKGKAHFLGGVGVGYMQWYNNAVLLTPVTIKSETYGVLASLGFDIKIYASYYLGFAGELLVGNGNSVTYSDGYSSSTRAVMIGMSHIDATIGLRYYLK